MISLAFGEIVAPLVGMGGEKSAVPMGIIIAALGIGAVLSYLLLVKKSEVLRENSISS